MTVKRLFALFPLLLLAACSGPVLEPLDPPAELLPIPAAIEARPLWERELGQGVRYQFLRLPPLVDADSVYAANKQGLVAAFAAADGKPLWRVKLERQLSGGPADGGEVLLLGGDAELLALEKKDGGLRWRAELGSEVVGMPLRSGERVLVRCVDGSLYALSASDGRQLWRFKERVPQLSLRGDSAPVVSGPMVIIGTATGRLRALSLEDGRELWSEKVSEARGVTEIARMVDVDAELLLSGSILYAAAYQGRLAAFAAASGRMYWSREIASYSGMAESEQALYITDQTGLVWALDKRSGRALWKSEALRGRDLSAPVRQGGYLIVGDYEGYLHWFDMQSGMIVGRARLEEPLVRFSNLADEYSHDYPEHRHLLAAPVVDGRRVYAVDKRGVLGAFEVTLIEE